MSELIVLVVLIEICAFKDIENPLTFRYILRDLKCKSRRRMTELTIPQE